MACRQAVSKLAPEGPKSIARGFNPWERHPSSRTSTPPGRTIAVGRSLSRGGSPPLAMNFGPSGATAFESTGRLDACCKQVARWSTCRFSNGVELYRVSPE